jgi:iron complex transport system ATP-binding protein
MSLLCSEIHINFGRHEVLRGVDLCVKRGKITVLLGQNGSGKTTLLKTLVGIYKPKNGEVTVDGIPVLSLSPKERARKVLYIPQEVENFPAFSVSEFLSLGRLHREDGNVKKVAETFGISEILGRNIRELSSGVRRRVLLALAFVQDSDYWLLDEPFTYMDIYSLRDVAMRIKEISKRKGVLLVTHDIVTARVLADEIYLINDGKIVVQGDVRSVLTEGNIKNVWGDIEFVLSYP